MLNNHQENKPQCYPLTSFERGMYLEQKLYPDSVSYNLNLGVTINGAPVEAVKDTLTAIFAAHEAFRSTYGEQDGLPVRIVTNELPEIIVKTAATKEEVFARINSDAEPFDLTAGIPVRTVLYQTADGEVILHLAIHHIAFDGTSIENLVRELMDGLTGEKLTPAPVDLSDLVDRETEEAHAKGLAFFRKMFADGVPVNEMPVRGKRPKTHPLSDRQLTFDVDREQAAALSTIAHKYGVTRFELIFAAVSMVLGKYTNSEDVVIGIPTDTRTEESKNVIGMFVNTAPVRVKPEREAPLSEYIPAVRKSVRAATRGEALPFESVVSEFVKTRDESRHPIFDVSVNYLWTSPVYQRNGISVEARHPRQQMGRDIGLGFHNSDNGMHVVAQYSSELFEDKVIEGFFEQLRHTLDLLGSEAVQTIRDALALPDEQLKNLEGFSAVDEAEIPVTLLHQLFEKSAEENADKTALIAKDQTLTYRELNESANAVAHNLLELGVKTGDSVVLLLPRESPFFSCLFGVNKAGAAFIPCDPQYPADRIRSIIEDSGAAYIITTKDKLSDYPADKAIDVADLLSGNTENPAVEMNADALAYMIYTSGSTGKPKGVMLSHKGICNYLMPHPANTHIHYLKNHIETYLSVTTVSFDMSFKEHTAALCNGKTLVFAAEDEMNDPRALAVLMNRYGVDCFNATPSRLQQYMKYEPFRAALAQCKLVMSGGEGYPISLRDAIKACSDNIKIINTYGPTEITVSCNAADLTDAPTVTVGRPLLNYTEYIVDKFGDLAPYGVTGELYVGGVGVAKGYRNLPEKTAEAFVTYRNQRMYRTGDYAKFDKDGNVCILGRLDSQVKLRGLRIELNEIEGLIEAQPKIKKAVVVIRPLGGQDNLCAYFTADEEINIDELRGELKKHLTHYMVPAAFLQMDELPVTANGKTDTKQLPELTIETQKTTAPQTDMQRQIAAIAAEVLGNSDLGVETELYAAGLTSLNSVGFCIKLSDAFGVNVQIRDLRDNDTVEKLEAFIQSLTEKDKETFDIRDEYAVTKTQEGIFFETLSHPDSTNYNIPTLLKLDSAVSLPKLKEAIAAGVNAHPYLMAQFFINQNGEIRQRRTERSFAASEIGEIQCASIDEIKADLIKPFDLQKDSLFRFKLLAADDGNYLFFDIHHIVFDGESKKILLRDVTAAYNGEPLTPETYSGYEATLVEEKLRAGAHYQASKEYYARLLDGVESDCVPLGDILSEEQPTDSGSLLISGKSELPSVIAAYCRQHSVSENAFCTAVFGWLLGKYCGREDAVFTAVNNGRNDPRFTNSVSMFVRTYPVYCNLETTGIDDYIKHIGRQLADSLQYDVYSFAEISRELGVTADVLFVYQSTMSGSVFDFCGAKAENIPLTFDEEKAKLEILIYPDGDKLNYHCAYDSKLYSEGFIRDLLATYERALLEFSEKDNTAEVQLVDDETAARLDAVNHFEHDYEITDIVTLFRRQAAKTPGNTAVVYLDHTYTYREVDRITENIAAFLRSKGVGKNDVVSVMIPRCEYMPIAAIGVHKAGAGYQPLDPSYPPERLEFMVEDADAQYLIADRSLMDRLPNCQVPVLYTDEIPGLPDAEKITENPEPSDLFIMLYTSGSTGVPKGVMLEHHNLCCFCEWYITTYQMDETSRASAYASYGFDCHMLDMYPVLLAGGQLHIIDESIRLDLIAIKEYFRANGITHTFMTTQVGRQYADLFPDATNPHHLSAAGEKLVPVEPPHGFQLYNGYGPTECTIFTHMHPVDKLYKRVPIGKPLFNMKQYIIDKSGNRLPFGIPGELVVAGHQVGRGYLNRPEKNAEVFIRNPFSDEPGYEHAYRTGDIARLMPDGTADFIGRTDGQVKIRGFRIELSEVEGVIRKFPGIKDATVQAFDEAGGGKFIAAYVVSDELVDVDALGEFIKRDKPAYMVPAVTMQIDHIPLNQNQKVNRRALPEPVKSAKSAETAQAARPLTRFEEEIAEVVKRLLGDAEISPTEPLTSCGLTSISAIGLVATLADKFNAEVSAYKLLDGASIVDIENMIFEQWMEQGFAQKAEPQPAADERPKTNKAPLSAVQLAVYYDAMKNAADVVYNIPMCLQFEKLDAQKLADAVKAAVSAHSYLNTHIELCDGELMQVCDGGTPVPVEVHTLNADELEQFKNSFIRPFDLHTGPLYRFAVVNAEDKTYLFLDIHHLIFDGMSSGVLLRDIGKAYTGEQLTPESYTYFDYAQEGDAFKQSDAYQESGAYFDKLFANFEAPAEIPSDQAGSAENGSLAEAYCTVSKQAVDTFCRDNNVQPSAFFLAAVFYTVSRFAGTKSVYLSTISSGRESVKTRNTVGMFVHTLPLAMHFDEKRSVTELIKASNSVMRESIANEHYSFAEIAAKFGYKTEIMYECQIGVIGDGGTVGGNAYKSVRLHFEAPKFKTVFAVLEHDGDYQIKVRYNDALYSQPYMQTLADAVKNAAEQMTADKDAAVHTLPLITEEERRALLALGQTAKQAIEPKLLHRVFENAAAANPQETALIACDKTLTYDELNQNANRIAHSLTEKGVCPGDSVVLLLPRRSFYFEALFGVLKAGAAFVPCDPAYPAERISHITEDSGARFIITTDEHAADYPAEKVLPIDSLTHSDNTENPDVPLTGQAPAYMIYTSGSTGKPKGVILTHEGICSFCTNCPANILYDTLSKGINTMLAVTTVSFDLSLKDTLGVLCNGKTVVFADEEQMNNPIELTRLMVENKVDAVNATPSRYQQYMEHAPFTEALRQCRLVMAGGEPFPEALLKRLQALNTETIINTYGPTETTISSNMAYLQNADRVSVGRPLLNYSEYIVDSDMNLLPRGVIGELLIGGLGVAKGYRNLPEQTEQRFITVNGERVYRSGDRAKWDKDGNVVILGRMDGQIKLRGLRIELGEIEGLMEQQPHIKRAAAAVRKIGSRENLCAWFTADMPIDLSALRDALAQKLTHYMVPAAMMQVEAIPVTPNGKTNVKALPDPTLTESGAYEAPVNAAEEFFCKLFAEILSLEKVGATDDFFSIGGTSLAVTSVMIKATESGYELTYGDVFKYTTPRQLAAKFTGGGDEKSLSAARFDQYDYSQIHAMLSHNNEAAFLSGEKRPLGNILLTGATGFMGIHVLAEYLKTQSGTAYCMVRKGRWRSAIDRIKNMLIYYFDETVEKELDRVQAFDGDVTNYDSFTPLLNLPIDTVFNCAASVKHFSSGTDIEDINVGGVQNCIRFCLEKGARLIHFSTTSVSGSVKNEPDAAPKYLDEQVLYFGQILENQYTSSKLLAERVLFEKVVQNGLDAKVIRVGTLAPREADGEFQINFLSNSFMGRLRSFAMLKAFPHSMINNPIRMGAIDESAKAFLLLAQTPADCRLFNAVNTHLVPLIDIIRTLKDLGLDIQIVEKETFDQALEQAEQDPAKAAILASMLAYKNMNGKNMRPVETRFDYTAKILSRMGFYWNNTDKDYIRRFIEVLIALSFFDENNLMR